MYVRSQYCVYCTLGDVEIHSPIAVCEVEGCHTDLLPTNEEAAWVAAVYTTHCRPVELVMIKIYSIVRPSSCALASSF